jgi:hypothetical protein
MSIIRSRAARVLGGLGLAGAAVASMLVSADASSHREAPLITEDPVADATDLYAFSTPDRPDAVTFVANYIPLEEPASGPNFHKFGDDVLYVINVDNNADAVADINYEFRFRTQVQNGATFLYNTGPITSLTDADFNIRQSYTVTEVRGGRRKVLGQHLVTPPVNIGPRSTPNYESLAAGAVNTLAGGIKVFAGQRDDPFFVDLGSAFDLLGLRPLNEAHALKLGKEDGIDGVAGYNTHSIVLQVPKSQLVTSGDPVIGVYTTSFRRKTRVYEGNDGARLAHAGPWVQVSRLGMPLVNEVVIPLKDKDRWNSSAPVHDSQFLKYVVDPEPGRLVPGLYPVFSCFPKAPRNDLVAVYLTGIPGLNKPARANARPSEMLRFNTSKPSGFPNGRNLADDVTDTTLVAVAGAALPIQECAGKSPNKDLTDGVAANDKAFTASFPYVAAPFQGYESDQNGTK